MQSFIFKLNPRQLIIYFIATWLFIYAVFTLSSLFDYSFLYKDFALRNRMIFKERFHNDMFIIHSAGYLGLISAYVISWQISEKKNWFWANSVSVFLIAFVLYYFNLMGWKTLMNVFLAPGQIVFKSDNVFGIILNGVLMLVIGSFLFFKKQIINFIDKGAQKDKVIRKKGKS